MNALPCPGCTDGSQLQAWPLRREDPNSPYVAACTVCGGVWVRGEVLDALIDAAAAQAPPDATPQRRALSSAGRVIYRKCPECRAVMQRKNFGRASGIILDVCAQHGTFFDYDELPGVLAFVRSGGLVLAKRREEQERARNAKRPRFTPYGQPGSDLGLHDASFRRHDSTAEFVAWASDAFYDT